VRIPLGESVLPWQALFLVLFMAVLLPLTLVVLLLLPGL
jgi:hypothetical protein